MNFTFELLWILSPETILILGGFLLLGWDLWAKKPPFSNLESRRLFTGIMLVSLLALVLMTAYGVPRGPGELFVMNPLYALIKMIFILLTLFLCYPASPEDYGRNRAEFFALMLFALAGFMLLVSSTSLITIFLSLEFASICLYGLSAINARRKEITEAAIKYFTFGATATAFLIFGMSLLFGLTGQVELSAIRQALEQGGGSGSVMGVSILFILVGFGFKTAMAPFHFWVPDVYEKVPLPVAGFIASVSGFAAFAALGKLLFLGLGGYVGEMSLSSTNIEIVPGWSMILAICAVAGMGLGNFAALQQRNLRRLLGYSAVAQGAFILVALVGFGHNGFIAMVYYNLAYSISVAGIFLMIGLCTKAGMGENIEDLTVVSSMSKPLAICAAFFFLSLAGVPPLAGFFAKFYVFVSAFLSPVNNPQGLMWLVALGLMASVIGFFYYLRIVKALLIGNAHESPSTLERISSVQIAPALLLLALVLFLGFFPQLWMDLISQSMESIFRLPH